MSSWRVRRCAQAGFAIFHVELVLAWGLAGLHHKAVSALDLHAIVPLLLDQVHEASRRDGSVVAIQHDEHRLRLRITCTANNRKYIVSTRYFTSSVILFSK